MYGKYLEVKTFQPIETDIGSALLAEVEESLNIKTEYKQPHITLAAKEGYDRLDISNLLNKKIYKIDYNNMSVIQGCISPTW